MQRPSSIWRHFDIWLVAAVLLLTSYGILMIRSAVTGAPLQANFPQLQIIWMSAGILGMLIIASIDYRLIAAGHWLFYGLMLVSLIALFALGVFNNAARRWFDLGLFQLQPSELGRFTLIITYAKFLSDRRDQINKLSNTAAALVYIGIPGGLIFLQPDLGMAILYMVMWFVMIWIAGLPISHFLLLIGLGGGATIILYPKLQSYQQVRLTSFLTPEEFPDEAFNVDQALIAIVTGNWFGKGYFEGTQSQLGFLRVQPTDFIFAMAVEELGFVFGALFILGMMLFILWRILDVVSLTPDPVGKLACAGIAGTLFFQTVVSVGMNLRLLPVTGLTLPFVSYGGSSLLTWYLTIGVVQSIRMRHRKQEFG